MAGFVLGALAASGERMIVVPRAGANFVPLDAANPDSARIAVLRGDPATGPSAMLMRDRRQQTRRRSSAEVTGTSPVTKHTPIAA